MRRSATRAMPTYTIQKDQPWISNSSSQGLSATSIYGDDPNAARQENSAPRTMQASYHPSYHAHPQQQIHDHGPQIRQSRLPIFKQVRSMLHRPPRLTTPSNPKWDEYTGELSESGKPSRVQPSTYVSPPQNRTLEPKIKQPTERPKKSRRDRSPVSVLRDEELTPVEPVKDEPHVQPDRSPVSPVSLSSSQGDDQFEDAVDRSLVPEPLSPNVQRASQQTSPSSHVIRRKPLSISTSENHPPSPPQGSPSQFSDVNATMDNEDGEEVENQPRSHFSWTTYAPTVAPARHSIDTMATRELPDDLKQPNSRFSWSTAATQPAPLESPPSSPPAFPANFSSPPMQSILSRRRPVQRIEKAEWVPPPPRARSGDSPPSTTTNNTSTPNSAATVRPLPFAKASTPTTATNSPSTTSKALPPPPHLTSTHNLTHLETLLAQERDILLQRKNMEKGIHEMEKIEKASPMDVSFAVVRDAKKRLAEYRTRLAEVLLEERDVGVAIARARRKEEREFGGDGETLWVRKFSR